MIVGSAYHLGRGGPGGWWIIDEPEVHFGENVVVPDVTGWGRERMPQIPKSHVFDVTPDWLCEVPSPSTAAFVRAKKLPLYARSGVSYTWLVDADQRYLEVKRLAEGRWTDVAVYSGADTVRAEPFTEVEIDMTLVWGPPPA